MPKQTFKNILEPNLEMPLPNLDAIQDPAVQTAILKLHEITQSRMKTVSEQLSAAAGLRGTVGIPKQRLSDPSKGHSIPALQASDRIVIHDSNNPTAGDPAGPNDDGAVVTYGFLKRWHTCELHWDQLFPLCHDDAVSEAASPAPTPVAASLVHEFWAHTFEVPDRSDIKVSDPGILENNLGVYFAMTLPVAAEIDEASFALFGPIIGMPQTGPVGIAIYAMDLANGAQSNLYPLIVQTQPQTVVATQGPKLFTTPLTQRVTLQPGMYAVAWFSFCTNYVVYSIDSGNQSGAGIPFSVVGLANKNAQTVRFGTVQLVGVGINATFPTVLTPNNTASVDQQILVDPVLPVIFFEDSQKFSGT